MEGLTLGRTLVGRAHLQFWVAALAAAMTSINFPPPPDMRVVILERVS